METNLEHYSITKTIPDGKSLISLISKSIRTKNLDAAIFLVHEFLNTNKNHFSHPTNDSIITHAVDSFTLGMWNIVHFTDKDNNNEWLLIQSTSFSDIIITENEILFIAKKPSEQVLKNIAKALKIKKDREVKFTHINSIGIKIGQTTPFHFFYDQFKFLPLLVNKNNNIVYNDINPVFFEPEIAFGIKLCNQIPDKKVLFYPNVITQNSCIATGYGGSDRNQKVTNLNIVSSNQVVATRVSECMINMESALFKSTPKVNINLDSNLCLWIGITSQKRSWIEQIDGYKKIINKLNSKFKSITVLVDGLTASLKSTPPIKEDLKIYDEIKNSVNKEVEFINLIGLTYSQKIAYGKHANVFISNAGTGSFIPLRVLKIPGVLHSNTRLLSFPDNYKNIRILFGSDDYEKCDIDKMSYSLNWEEIYEALPL